MPFPVANFAIVSPVYEFLHRKETGGLNPINTVIFLLIAMIVVPAAAGLIAGAGIAALAGVSAGAIKTAGVVGAAIGGYKGAEWLNKKH